MLHIADVIAGVPELARLLDDEAWVTPMPRIKPLCNGVDHEWEILRTDCECVLDVEGVVHDVIMCGSCQLQVHETPYYTEGV